MPLAPISPRPAGTTALKAAAYACVVAAQAACFTGVATATEIGVAEVLADGRKLSPPKAGGPWELPAGTAQVTIRTFQKGDPENALRVAAHLAQTKATPLEPLRSLHLGGSCFIGPVILDQNKDELSSGVVPLDHDSPGWTGDVFTSGYQARKVTMKVPPGASTLVFLISNSLGRQEQEWLGVQALRRCTVTLLPAKPGTAAQVLHLLEPQRIERQLWDKRGNLPSMSSAVFHPVTHAPILVVEDRSTTKWAGWASERVPLAGVSEVRVEWEMAYSLGLPSGQFTFDCTSADLQPGALDFQLSTSEYNGLLAGSPHAVPLLLLPPFYQRPAFQTGAALACIVALTLIVRHSATTRLQRQMAALEKQRAVEHERSRIARDLHDHLGADLTQLAMLSDVLQNTYATPEENHCRLDHLFELAQNMTRQVDEIVWTVNPEHDTLRALVAYLTTHTQQYLSATGLRCRLRIPNALPEVVITAARRHHLFMLLKEALHNIVKHAHATEVSLEITASPRQFTLSICDDGDGLPENLKPGDGLLNMQERARQAGGTLTIDSTPSSGTRLHLIVPLSST